jgi:anti-sigma factor RsiW
MCDIPDDEAIEMTCTSTRELIESYLDGEVDASLRAEVQDHLTSCSSCAETYARLRELQGNVRSQAPYYDPPADLRRRVRTALAQAANSEGKSDSVARRSAPWQWIAIAASVLLAVSLALNVALFRPQGDDRDTLAQNIVSSHVRSLIGAHLLDVPSSDQHTVKPWFSGKLDFSPDVKDFASEGFPLMGGRIEYMADRPAAALVYQRRRHVINVFIWPSVSSASSADELARNGYNIIHWSKAGMTYWAVSDLGLNELRQFAELYKRDS